VRPDHRMVATPASHHGSAPGPLNIARGGRTGLIAGQHCDPLVGESVALDEDALARHSRTPRPRRLRGPRARGRGRRSRLARSSPRRLLHIGETVVEQGEDRRRDLFAETVAGAEILIIQTFMVAFPSADAWCCQLLVVEGRRQDVWGRANHGGGSLLEERLVEGAEKTVQGRAGPCTRAPGSPAPCARGVGGPVW